MRALLITLFVVGCAGRAPELPVVDEIELPRLDLEGRNPFLVDAPRTDCPVAVAEIVGDAGVFAPFDDVALTAENSVPKSDGAPIVEATWSVVQRPTGSSTTMEDADRLDGTLRVDLPGRYTVALDVVDADGVSNCRSTTLTLNVTAPGDVFVVLTWDHPTADLDLHTVREGGQAFSHEDDVYFSNRTPDPAAPWSSTEEENPSLDVDDDDGFGPEVMTIVRFVPGMSFQIAVHYWSAQTNADPRTQARLDVFLDGVGVADATHFFEDDEQLWTAFKIAWPLEDDAPSVRPIDSLDPFARPF